MSCSQRAVNICIHQHPYRAALTAKPCLQHSKVYCMKAKFLSFHRERAEAEEHCLRMFHIPTSPAAHSLHPSSSPFLNQSSFHSVLPYLSPFLPPCLPETNSSFLPLLFLFIPMSSSFNFPPFSSVASQSMPFLLIRYSPSFSSSFYPPLCQSHRVHVALSLSGLATSRRRGCSVTMDRL